ncbi:MAG: hypothetical protein R3F51_19695 [Cyanobacteriota/Melainabacteria group bacterium]
MPKIKHLFSITLSIALISSGLVPEAHAQEGKHVQVCPPPLSHNKFNNSFTGPARYKLYKSIGRKHKKLIPVAELRVDKTGHIELVLLNKKPFSELTKEQAESLFGPQKGNHLEGCRLHYPLYSENKKYVFYMMLIFKSNQIWKYQISAGSLGSSDYELVNR